MCHKEADEIQKSVYKEKRTAEHFMNFVPIIFLPHLHGCYKFDKPEVIKASEFTNLPVFAISDDSALKIIDNEPPVILGNDYIVAQNGKIIKEHK